jgi:hypothetical protein
MLAFPLRRMTPEDHRLAFQYHLRQHPGDQQMSLGVQISREWKSVWYQRTVSQDDLDRLLAQFTQYVTGGMIGGTCIPFLWDHVAAWGRELGLSVPDEPPWWPPPPPFRPQPSEPVRVWWLSAPWLNEES